METSITQRGKTQTSITQRGITQRGKTQRAITQRHNANRHHASRHHASRHHASRHHASKHHASRHHASRHHANMQNTKRHYGTQMDCPTSQNSCRKFASLCEQPEQPLSNTVQPSRSGSGKNSGLNQVQKTLTYKSTCTPVHYLAQPRENKILVVQTLFFYGRKRKIKRRILYFFAVCYELFLF